MSRLFALCVVTVIIVDSAFAQGEAGLLRFPTIH